MIVESPTKARKLKSYLGKDYQVEASMGHVRDLPKSGLGIDLEKNYQPEYQVDSAKTKVITLLKKLAKTSDEVILATDPDREGEAIAWHLSELIGQAKTKFVRAVFHEITQQAVLDAMAKPGKINSDLVDAQQARRVLDRLVGYKVSPILWRKVRRGLSAGRVQSVALRLVAEREREIEAFKPEEYWEVDVELKPDQAQDKDKFLARLTEVDGKKYQPVQAADVEPVVACLKKAAYRVVAVEQKERRRASLPPFITSTLQQAAANRLGYSSRRTMSLAQDLYEEGLITYHRTDSFNLAEQAINAARAYIGKTYGEKYLPESPRRFRTSSKSAQEAHEAIRVTDITLLSNSIVGQAKLTSAHQKLYDLIWRRFAASQMSASVTEQTSADIEAIPSSSSYQRFLFKATGSVLVFDGWTKLFAPSEDVILPKIKAGDKLDYLNHQAEQKFTQPPARYNDASLVKELEKRGIGRPSTYASIISVIIERGYVERQEKRFFCTSVGLTVNDFLLKHFPKFMDYDFTAKMEDELDEIAAGSRGWVETINQFYQPFSKQIEEVTEKADRVKIPVEETGEICPECGEKEGGKLVIRSGRFGKFISCSRFPECRYTNNLVEKLDEVSCPLCGQGEVVVKRSRWGRQFYGCSRYPECDWASSRKPNPGDKITAKAWEEEKAKRKERSKGRKTRSKKKK